jgi:hypothetical protein
MGLFLIDQKQKHKHRVLTEETLNIIARLEHTPKKSLKRLAQETGMSKRVHKNGNTIAGA